MIENNSSNVKSNNFDTIFDKITFDKKNVRILVDEKSTNLKQVVFATDFSNNSFEAYLNVLEVAKTENFVINFLHIGPDEKSGMFTKAFKAALKRFTQICPIANIGIIWETTATNIAKGIEEVVDKFGGEVVVLACKNDSSVNLHRRYLSNYTSVRNKLSL